jgi:hypothetical protein
MCIDYFWSTICPGQVVGYIMCLLNKKVNTCNLLCYSTWFMDVHEKLWKPKTFVTIIEGQKSFQKNMVQYLGLGHDKGHAFCAIKSHENEVQMKLQ